MNNYVFSRFLIQKVLPKHLNKLSTQTQIITRQGTKYSQNKQQKRNFEKQIQYVKKHPKQVQKVMNEFAEKLQQKYENIDEVYKRTAMYIYIKMEF